MSWGGCAYLYRPEALASVLFTVIEAFAGSLAFSSTAIIDSLCCVLEWICVAQLFHEVRDWTLGEARDKSLDETVSMMYSSFKHIRTRIHQDIE